MEHMFYNPLQEVHKKGDTVTGVLIIVTGVIETYKLKKEDISSYNVINRTMQRFQSKRYLSSLKSSTIDAEDNYVPLTRYSAGQYIGAEALLCGSKYTSSARAITETNAYFLSQENIDAITLEEPEVGFLLQNAFALSIASAEALEMNNLMLRKWTESSLPATVLKKSFMSLHDKSHDKSLSTIVHRMTKRSISSRDDHHPQAAPGPNNDAVGPNNVNENLAVTSGEHTASVHPAPITSIERIDTNPTAPKLSAEVGKLKVFPESIVGRVEKDILPYLAELIYGEYKCSSLTKSNAFLKRSESFSDGVNINTESSPPFSIQCKHYSKRQGRRQRSASFPSLEVGEWILQWSGVRKQYSPRIRQMLEKRKSAVRFSTNNDEPMASPSGKWQSIHRLSEKKDPLDGRAKLLEDKAAEEKKMEEDMVEQGTKSRNVSMVLAFNGTNEEIS